MFSKILIADRGATAVRIARTCERLGIATVAVHGEADAAAPHVQACGEAVCIAGPSPYDDANAILAAAQASGAEAVHPGGSTLAWRATFAEALAGAGIAFIGATAETLTRVVDRIAMRALAVESGVRIVPGAEVTLRDLDAARAAAERLGTPLRVTPAMRSDARALRMEDLDSLLDTLQTVSRDATRASGDGRVYFELDLERPRRVDVQLLADAVSTVALGERECSVRQSGAPLVTEQPAPALVHLVRGDFKRRVLADAAIEIAKGAGLRGAATAVFLLDTSGRIHFVGLDPRLGPEHVVTEMYTGIDLVEEQLRIAAGEGLTAAAKHAEPTGHAIQAHVYTQGAVAPEGGSVETLRWPVFPPGSLRVETTLAAASTVPAEEHLLATVTAYHQTRHQALLTLDRLLAEAAIGPLATNLLFLRRVMGDESFRAGQYDSEFAARLHDEAIQPVVARPD